MNSLKRKKNDRLIGRREFIKLLGMNAACVSVITASGLGCSKDNSRKRPNIIFILADDLGYGDVGVYGQKKIRTPYLDQMAAEGIRFTDAYCGAPVCAPSRSTLMTGQHTGHTRIRGNRSAKTRERIPLLPENITVAEVLKSMGYTTGIVGKWGLGEPGSTGTPNKKGFDYWFGYLNQGNAHYYYPPFLWRNGDKVYLEENNDGRRGFYSHDLFTQEALNFIEQNKDRPFFLYLPYTIPHAELLVPEDSLNEYKGHFPEEPYVGRPDSYASQPTPHAAYAAMITRMDRDIGKLLKKLSDLGIEKDTIVFFSSDNGPSDAGGIDAVFFKSSGPLRGIKRDLYEGGIRVPMIVWWPGKIKAGSISNTPWAFWDFLPTAAEIAGAKSPDNIDGISMLPAILGKPQKNHDFFYWEYKRGKKEFKQAVRMGDWKAFRRNPSEPIELYNLKTDLAETKNVASENLNIIAEVKEILRSSHTESEHWPMLVKGGENK